MGTVIERAKEIKLPSRFISMRDAETIVDNPNEIVYADFINPLILLKLLTTYQISMV